MTAYADGKRVEDKVRDHLRDHGWWTISARSSKGAADIVATSYQRVAFVSVKKANPVISPKERRNLLTLADQLPLIGLPVVATKTDRKPIVYRLLTGTGPKDWVDWTPEAEAVTG